MSLMEQFSFLAGIKPGMMLLNDDLANLAVLGSDIPFFF